MEREKFEASWKEAFEKAEVSPSDNVWTNIELDLEKEKGGHLKKRLLFFQMLAAASVVFAMAIGGAGYYYAFNSRLTDGDLAVKAPAEVESPARTEVTPAISPEETETSPEKPGDIKKNDTAPTPVVSGNAPASADRSGQELAFLASPTNASANETRMTRSDNTLAGGGDIPVNAIAENKREPYLQDLPRTLDDSDLPSFYQPRKIDLRIPDDTQSVDPVVAMLARLEQREREVSGEEKNAGTETNTEENLWTSIGFAAGSFNTMHSSVSNTSRNSIVAMNAPIVDQEAKASGYSYSMGVNVGTKISERWVLQGGVNYLTHSSDYTAHNAVAATSSFLSFKPASTNELVKADHQEELSEKIVYTAPYNINNSLRYLSIPMQAGYLLINSDFGLQVNAGVATDLFLQNTLKGDGDRLDNTTQSSGADSPYRSFNLSGLFGTELSYRFSEHYRVSLNPGIRYPFNTIYKSELGVQASPLTFDVGLRFRYIFH